MEFFHSAPTVDDVLFCIQKQIERRRKRRDPAVDPAPRLWILAAGPPAFIDARPERLRILGL